MRKEHVSDRPSNTLGDFAFSRTSEVIYQRISAVLPGIYQIVCIRPLRIDGWARAPPTVRDAGVQSDSEPTAPDFKTLRVVSIQACLIKLRDQGASPTADRGNSVDANASAPSAGGASIMPPARSMSR